MPSHRSSIWAFQTQRPLCPWALQKVMPVGHGERGGWQPSASVFLTLSAGFLSFATTWDTWPLPVGPVPFDFEDLRSFSWTRGRCVTLENWAFLFCFSKFIYFINFIFGCVGSSLLRAGFSLVAVSGGYSWLWCTGFSLWWLLVVEHGL